MVVVYSSNHSVNSQSVISGLSVDRPTQTVSISMPHVANILIGCHIWGNHEQISWMVAQLDLHIVQHFSKHHNPPDMTKQTMAILLHEFWIALYNPYLLCSLQRAIHTSYGLLLQGKKLSVKLSTSRDGPVKSTKTRQGWKHKKTTLLQKYVVIQDL